MTDEEFARDAAAVAADLDPPQAGSRSPAASHVTRSAADGDADLPTRAFNADERDW